MKVKTVRKAKPEDFRAIQKLNHVKTGELNDMCVAPEARRSGAGRKLVEALKAWMKGRGTDRVYVSVFTKNSRALAFYKAMGFREWEMGLEMKLSE